MTTIDRKIPLNVLQNGPSRPIYANGPRSLESVRMLRISVTDRCNLRCGYCMPASGVSFQPKEDLLTPEDLAKISGFAYRLGVRHFKITGGEPTVRGDLIEIIQRIRAFGSADLSMTSNGLQMPRLAGPLKEAGIDRVTLSVDSLQPDRYRDITGGGRFDLFERGLDATAEVFGTVKLNVVVMRGVNDDEVADFAGLARDRDWTVRFIEFMPLGSSVLADGDPDQFLVTADEVTAAIESVHGPLTPVDAAVDPGVGPARLLAMPGGRGRIGLIHAMSRPFCETCNRLRLTSSGILRSCLFDGGEVDLLPILRDESHDSELASDKAFFEAFTRCTAMKPDVHASRGGRAMSSIGG